jgi:transcriptional regulator with XRE-family HTH domain
MAQQLQIVAGLKTALKERGLTYADVATALKLSLASVKRLFSTGTLTLDRVDRICELAGVELSEVLEREQERARQPKKLSITQEREIVTDPKLFLVTWLILNRTQFADIVRDYRFTERELLRYLLKLDRLKVIELQPGNRVRILVSRNSAWRAGGPVQAYIHQRLLKEFLSAHFIGPLDEFAFHGGSVTPAALGELKRVLQNASRECAEIVDRDRTAAGDRSGAAMLLALRPWQYSGFTQLLRD